MWLKYCLLFSAMIGWNVTHIHKTANSKNEVEIIQYISAPKRYLSILNNATK
jgi:hypothetical protein